MTATGRAAPIPVTTVEGISEYRLDNGLRILLCPDPSKPQVTVNLTVLVGSRHEGYGEAGMAHLLEHMLFKGTPDHPQIPKVLQEHGAEFNGTTSFDRTNYYETLPASVENLDFALRLEADRMINSFVKDEDLRTEMTVVRNEFERGENSPERILFQKIMSAAFEWHNYGQSTIGNRADIERVPIENLQRFYRKYYQPDNAMLIVSGAFEPEDCLERIDKYFGPIPRPERVLDKTYTEEPAQDGERLVTLRRVGEVGLAGAVYHIPSAGHPDYVPIDVLEHILTSSPSGRLYQGLVETKIAARVSGAAFGLHDPGVMRFIAECAPGTDPRDLLSRMLEIIETIGDEGVTEEEVARAQRYWMKIWELSFSDSGGLARQLSEWEAQGDWRLMFLYRDQLEQVTVEAVNEMARKYLRQSNRTAGLFIPTTTPERTNIPVTPDLAELIGDYQGRESLAEGETFDVSPENIERRTERVTLPSGLKAAFLPKKTRGESVHLWLNLRYGTAESLSGLKTACEALPVLMLRGTQQLSRQEIQDRLDACKARLLPEANPGEATFVLETRREHLPAALEILRQVLREPTLPEPELEIIRNLKLASAEQNLSDPVQLARVATSRRISPEYPADDPRHIASIREEIARWKEIQRSDVARLYTDFLNGSHGEVVVLGDFDTAEIQPLLEQMFSGWQVAHPYAPIPRSGIVEISADREEILTPDKENAIYFAATVFPMSDSNPDLPPLTIGNFILGSSGLSSRLGDRVRQQEGLSYGVGSQLRTSALDERTTLLVYAIVNPAKMGQLETVIREEIEKLLEQGITAEELAASQRGYLEGKVVDRANDRQLAGLLAATLQYDRTMEFYAQREQAIRELTVEGVNEVLRKWIDLNRLAVVVAGDFPAGNQPEAAAQP